MEERSPSALIFSRERLSASAAPTRLRMEFTPNGPPNIAEFGTVTDPDGFKASCDGCLPARQDGTAYPGLLLTAGINDPRVDPSQPAKMAARLQAATSSDVLCCCA